MWRIMNRVQRFMDKLHKTAVKRKKDNRGSSIVIVIIAMAMIGILATTLLWMAYMNYMIKVNDIRNKNSFYSAETVMEQIMAGMQHEASDAVAAAYQEVLTNWDGLENEQNRYNTFVTAYMDILAQNLKGTYTGTYDRDKLRQFVDTSVFANVDEISWNNGNAAGETAKQPILEMVNNNSIILRNIYVSYYDSVNDRLSIVNTDICLDVPKLVFTQTDADILYEYLLIGNEGVEVVDSCGMVTAEGSIYAGTDALGDGGLKINYASTLTVDDSRKVISAGDINVEGPTAGLVVRSSVVSDDINEIYGKNITLKDATVSLDGATYIADDLTLTGTGSKATLTKEYYGYGVSTYNGFAGEDEINPKESSAILINGRSAAVDMSGINKLLLAGRSYIGQPSSQSVMMGESIAVKGGQIAYLVPAECIGVTDDGILVGQNPVSSEREADIEQYKIDYVDENGVQRFREVDFQKQIYKLGGKSLSDFGVTDMTHIRKVHAQYLTGSGSTTLTYYYLVLEKDKAAEYFAQYYDVDGNKEAMDNYFKKYASGGIILGDYSADDTQYTILGNGLISSALTESGVALLTEEDYEKALADEADVMALSVNIANRYKALCTNLSEDISTINPADTTRNVFNSLLKETELTDYLADHGNTITYKTDNGLQAVFTNQDITLSGISDYKNVRLIVSLGNVTIDRNFTGQVIAKGKITIENGASTLKQDKMELYKALNGTTGVEGDTITPLDFFVNGGGSLLNGAEEAVADEAGNLVIDYSKIVRYVNWIKK